MAYRVTFDVGGQIFKISSRALENGPPSKLTKLYKTGNGTSGSINLEIDRPADLFAPVIALYQTGELHFPISSCPAAFMRELEFWEIAPEVTESCCFNRLQSFLDEQNTLRSFQHNRDKHTYNTYTYPNSFIRKLWAIVDYSKPSMLARIYFTISVFMVLMSIVTLALSTDPYFRRNMTNCERLEYMEYSGMEKLELAKKWLKRSCDNETMPHHRPPPGAPPQNPGEDSNECSPMTSNWYKQVYLRHNPLDDESGGNKKSANVSDNFPKSPDFNKSAGETPQAPESQTVDGEYIELPDFKIPIETFVVLEIITLAYFTLDLLLRLISCPSIKQYFFSLINFTDALALICTYMHFILMNFLRHERYKDNWMDVLKFTQVLRSFRFFRIISNVRAGQVLAYTVRSNLNDLSVIILFLIAGVSIFASCLFFAEEREVIRSIPVGWYWAIVSMTTVGYGDIAPRTAIGRILACLCTLAGIVLLALTVPIFANNFLTLYQFVDSEKAVKKFQKRKSNSQKTDLTAPIQKSIINNNVFIGDIERYEFSK